jgi:micrococcal nuclease
MAGRKTKKPYYAMRRTRKNALLLAVFLFIALAAVVDRQFLRPVRQTVRVATWASEDYKRYHRKTFTVAEVIDGDTLDIDAPDGEKAATRIRLIGVDTPETKHPTTGVMYYGPQASEYARQLAGGQRVTVLLDTVSAERDRYGRLLAYVALPDGRTLNEELIRTGHGYADLRFSHTRFDNFVSLMDTAITQKAGLWEHATRKQLPAWLQRERAELLR